jgi:probable addiction module antidote protein
MASTVRPSQVLMSDRAAGFEGTRQFSRQPPPAEDRQSGDVPVGVGIREMRIHDGLGVGADFKRRGKELIIIVAGGDKSTWVRDIAQAKSLPSQLEEAAMTGQKIAFQDFDSAEYLDTSEAIAAYLDDVFADGDEALIAQALGVIARSKGMARIAEETDLARPSLDRALSATGNPELSTLLKVLKALGLRLAVEPAEPARA